MQTKKAKVETQKTNAKKMLNQTAETNEKLETKTIAKKKTAQRTVKQIKKRKLGRTDLMVSEIGFGTIPIQRISVEKSAELIEKARLHDMNFIDVARAWTDTEEKVGAVLEQTNSRNNWIICSKSPAITYNEMKREIETSLKLLKTDCIDVYQIHHLKDAEMLKVVMSENGALRALKEAQKDGEIRFSGVSGHDLATLLLVAKTGEFDTLMINYNFKEQEAEKELLPYCEKNGIGTIIMKALAGGTFQNASAAVRFCLANEAVSTVIPGIGTLREFQEDVTEAIEGEKYSKEDEKKLAREVGKIGRPYCRACGYCTTRDGGCPVGINIPLLFRLEGYFEKYGPKDWIVDAYNGLDVDASACILCGHCEKMCPFSLPIMRSLRKLKVRSLGENTLAKKAGKKDKQSRTEREESTAASTKEGTEVPTKEVIENRKAKGNSAGERTKQANDDYQQFVEKTKSELGEDHAIPLSYFELPRSANEGQRATVRKLIEGRRALPDFDSDREKQMVSELCKTMKIACADEECEQACELTLDKLLMLADYDNVVDMMRTLSLEIRAK